MQAIQRNKTTNNHHAGRAAQQYVMGGEARSTRLSKRLKSAEAAHQDDDCHARYDKISKQMDDALEGARPSTSSGPRWKATSSRAEPALLQG